MDKIRNPDLGFQPTDLPHRSHSAWPSVTKPYVASCWFIRPSNGLPTWSSTDGTLALFLSPSPIALPSSPSMLSLNVISQRSSSWSLTCGLILILYISWHFIFLPNTYHSCKKIVMWLDIQFPQHYVCKLYEGNFIYQNSQQLPQWMHAKIWLIFIKYMIEWHVHYCVVNVSNIANAQQYLMTKWKCCLFRKKRGATAGGRESSQSQWEDPLRMMETQGEYVMDYLDA